MSKHMRRPPLRQGTDPAEALYREQVARDADRAHAWLERFSEADANRLLLETVGLPPTSGADYFAWAAGRRESKHGRR